jgi:hypothetical protein
MLAPKVAESETSVRIDLSRKEHLAIARHELLPERLRDLLECNPSFREDEHPFGDLFAAWVLARLIEYRNLVGFGGRWLRWSGLCGEGQRSQEEKGCEARDCDDSRTAFHQLFTRMMCRGKGHREENAQPRICP